MRNARGTGASPVLAGNQLIIVNDNEEESWVVAFDKLTGRELWKTKRDEPSNWATPFVWKHDGGKELVLSGRRRTRSYDLSGKELGSFQRKKKESIGIPTAFEAHGLLVVASGYVGDREKHVDASRPGAKGESSIHTGEDSNKVVAR